MRAAISTLVLALGAGPGACVDLRDESGLQDCSVREKASRDAPLDACLRASELMGRGDLDATTGLPCILAEAAREADCIIADADVLLCSQGGAIDVEFELTHSGVSVDCNGQRISHAENKRKRSAFRTPYERSVADIEISSCSIEYPGRYGVDLKRLFRGDQLDGAMPGHRNIAIRDVEIFGSERVGIYVGQNSRDIEIESVRIQQAFSGIYLEAGSSRTRVRDSVVLDSYERAGIHIDSSTDNTIEGSHFSGNRGGAIQMYKNCGELYGQVCPIRRTSGASNNRISGNQFYGGDVYVAYRQFKAYGPEHCAGISVLGFWRDRASGNTISNNAFYGGAHLNLRDAGNTVADNLFEDAVLVVGANDPLGDPPIKMSGNVVDNNFEGASWLGVVGDRGKALANVAVCDNTRRGSAPLGHFRPKLACSDTDVLVRSGGDCYGSPEEIKAATCP